MKLKKEKGEKKCGAAEPAAVFDTIVGRISSLWKINGSIGARSSRTTTGTWYSSRGIIAHWENTISRNDVSPLILVIRLVFNSACLFLLSFPLRFGNRTTFHTRARVLNSKARTHLIA